MNTKIFGFVTLATLVVTPCFALGPHGHGKARGHAHAAAHASAKAAPHAAAKASKSTMTSKIRGVSNASYAKGIAMAKSRGMSEGQAISAYKAYKAKKKKS